MFYKKVGSIKRHQLTIFIKYIILVYAKINRTNETQRIRKINFQE
nr:MAG TPA: hypothetical protein [Bacteriophage sp.]DAP70936.1 MAG TPA: hypothetical protein [Caudoviricetes sp.]DAU33850.1 MAG TPA: hypothetical protein [Caudoviricetes sp.]